jgi:hypothetical protein
MGDKEIDRQFEQLASEFFTPEVTSLAKEQDLSNRYSEIFTKLRERGIGRPITHTAEKNYDVLVGVILPLNENNTKHLAVFRTGDMLVLGPKKDEKYDIREYKNAIAESTGPYMVAFNDLNIGIDRLRESTLRVITLYSNNDPERLDEFDELFDQAIQLGFKLKAKKDIAKGQSNERFIDKTLKAIELFDAELHGDDPKGDIEAA